MSGEMPGAGELEEYFRLHGALGAAAGSAQVCEFWKSTPSLLTFVDSRYGLFRSEEQAWAEIEHYLRGMQPYDFQDLVADLLRAMGYHVSWVSPPGKDGGIDILAHTDPLGTRPPRIKVQVKRQVAAVNSDGLRSFMALLGDDDVGLFVSTGGFTKDAADEARTQEKRKITLVTLDRLFDLWVEHYARLTDTARKRLPLRPIQFLEPSS